LQGYSSEIEENKWGLGSLTECKMSGLPLFFPFTFEHLDIAIVRDVDFAAIGK